MDNEKFLSKFADIEISGDTFLNVLLQLLYKKGVKEITEEELSKKLYSFYTNPKYKKLFLDLHKDRYEDKVNLYEAMFLEKYFSGNIWWSSNSPKILHLEYKEEFTLPIFVKINDEDMLLFHEIADQLALNYKLESTSKHKLNIYNFDPNQKYVVVCGKRSLSLYEWQIITDGKIKSTNEILRTPHQVFEDPNDYYSGIGLTKYDARSITLKDATYAIKQGIVDDSIRKIEIYTRLNDLEKLKQIASFANELNRNVPSLLPEYESISVRKLMLK